MARVRRLGWHDLATLVKIVLDNLSHFVAVYIEIYNSDNRFGHLWHLRELCRKGIYHSCDFVCNIGSCFPYSRLERPLLLLN